MPAKEFCIMPREKKDIEIRFNPQMRLHHFSQQISYKIIENQEERKLLKVSGACHGIELKIMEDTIGFGSVVINSKFTRQVQMINLGDIGAHFTWDTRFCEQFFTISPK